MMRRMLVTVFGGQRIERKKLTVFLNEKYPTLIPYLI